MKEPTSTRAAATGARHPLRLQPIISPAPESFIRLHVRNRHPQELWRILVPDTQQSTASRDHGGARGFDTELRNTEVINVDDTRPASAEVCGFGDLDQDGNCVPYEALCKEVHAELPAGEILAMRAMVWRDIHP